MFLTLCIHIPLISFHIRYDAALKQRSELKLKMRRNSVELKLACIDYDIIFTSKPSIIKTSLSQICTQKIHVFTCTAHRRNLYVPGFLIVRQVHLACFTSGLEPTQRMPIPCATSLNCHLGLRDPSRRSQTSSSCFSYQMEKSQFAE